MDFLLDIKRHTFGEKYQFFQLNAVPFSVFHSNIIDFKETDLFQENDQNEHILVIPMDFQKRVSYRLQFLHRKLPTFSEITDSYVFTRKSKKYQILGNFQKTAFYRLVYVMNRFQWIFIKSPYFSEITDFNGISKDSLIPFGVLIL